MASSYVVCMDYVVYVPFIADMVYVIIGLCGVFSWELTKCQLTVCGFVSSTSEPKDKGKA